MEAPICPIHGVALKMEVRKTPTPGPYLYCKLAAQEGTDCPDMSLAEWKKKAAEQNSAEMREIAEGEGGTVRGAGMSPTPSLARVSCSTLAAVLLFPHTSPHPLPPLAPTASHPYGPPRTDSVVCPLSVLGSPSKLTQGGILNFSLATPTDTECSTD